MVSAVLTVSRAMVAYGLIAIVSFFVDRRYVVAKAGSELWTVAIIVGLVNVGLGIMLWTNGERLRNVARNGHLALIAGSFVLSSALKPSIVTAITILTSAAFALLLWGKPGRARTVVGYVVVVLATLTLLYGATKNFTG
jgi:hypothetical protein